MVRCPLLSLNCTTAALVVGASSKNTDSLVGERSAPRALPVARMTRLGCSFFCGCKFEKYRFAGRREICTTGITCRTHDAAGVLVFLWVQVRKIPIRW